MMGLPDIAIGAVVAALIAGLVSLLGLIVSKEQKVSEFRQAWIDALRSEIAALISHANAIYGANAAKYGKASDMWEVVRQDFFGINQATASIRLRLNPKEKEATSVLLQIEMLEKLLSPGQAIDYKALNETEKKLVAEAQIVLKQEWLRVQRGEQVYRTARVMAFAIIIACIIALLAVAIFRIANYEF